MCLQGLLHDANFHDADNRKMAPKLKRKVKPQSISQWHKTQDTSLSTNSVIQKDLSLHDWAEILIAYGVKRVSYFPCGRNTSKLEFYCKRSSTNSFQFAHIML